MGYDLHFTRADFSFDSALFPISLAEWTAVADAEPQMIRHGAEGSAPEYEFVSADGTSRLLSWRQGGITIWKGGGVAAELAAIAAKLDARLVGDDSEEYHADGSYTHWSGPRPILFHRPLNVAEAAAAWEVLFERQGDNFYYWRPSPDHARHALGAFRMFAARAVTAADVADADGLLYQYGPFGSEGDPVFALSLVRQLATDAEDGLVQVECRLDFEMGEDLAGLGSFSDWWFPEHGGAPEEWFDALEARPEWQLLNLLTPLSFRFGTDTVC
ncbi:hypothetical protein [Catenulispora rubra]|uniref:hypothetical protein n=1 Tax=Catenulispora rubra TaxID=280293 RepID=UPI001891F3CC|nr:hypothetical protein [Catenulispora rubra]